MRLSEYVDGFVVAKDYRPTSASHRRVVIGRFIAEVGDVEPNDITVEAVHRWWGSLAGNAASSRRTYLAAVRTFCEHLRVIGALDGDPLATLRTPRVPDAPPVTLTDAEVARLLATPVHDAVTAVAIALMLGCGLRGGDVANLDAAHVDCVERLVRVHGKGGKVRLVPMPERVAAMLEEFIDGRRDGPLLVDDQGRRMSSNSVRARVTRFLEVAGVKRHSLDGRSSHVLRRTCATELLAGGVATIRDVQAILGHASLSSTQRYLALPDAQRLRCVIEAGPLGDAA
jgi:integrase/recombinase XerC